MEMERVASVIWRICPNASLGFLDGCDRFRVYLPIPEGDGLWRWIICTDEIEAELYKLGYVANLVPHGMWEEGWCEFIKIK